MSAVCKSCGAEIVWARTTKGKAIPLDAEPVGQKGLFKVIAGVAITDEEPLYQTHFVSCPNAAGHRKA